ncbi:MAG: trehalose-6-phosphate synthase, partial [Sciscionella sp.]
MADLRIAGTVPVVVAAGIALAWGIGRYRGATLGPLRSALSRVISAAPAEDVITLADPDAIIKKLRKRGVSDFYSAYDLFRPEDHTPRWATWLPSWWVRALGSARSARQGQLGLTPAETRALGLALDEVASHGDIPRRRSPRPGAVVSTGGGTPMRSPVPALAVVGGVVLGMSGHPLLGAVAVLLGGLAWVGPALVRTAARGGYALARFLRRANAPPSRMITVVADVLAARGRRQVVPDLIINKRAIAQVADADGGLDIDASGRVQGEEGAGGLIKNFRGIVNLERHGITWLAAATNDPERRAAERAGGEPFLLHVPRSAETYRLLLGVSDRHDFQLFNEVAADSRLWLELHGMGRRLGPVTPTERDAFEAFFRVNGHIAAAALRYLDGRTAPLVMIRDYHFTDVPRLIRVARPDVTLHQFIHDSFAAPEHWLRSDGIGPELVDRLIGGLLGNDIVGFHTPTDVDNFLNTARALGYAIDLEARTVSVEDGREVWVRHYPGQANVASLDLAAAHPEVQSHRDRLAKLFAQGLRHLTVRVDRTDPTKNIVLAFRAYEELLAERPELRGSILFSAILPESRAHIEVYSREIAEIITTAKRINRRFAGTDNLGPVQNLDQWRPIEIYLDAEGRSRANTDLMIALYENYTIHIANSVRDGLHLGTKEAPYLNRNNGVSILTSTVGAWHELKDFVLGVDPDSLGELLAAMRRAIDMPTAERARR